MLISKQSAVTLLQALQEQLNNLKSIDIGTLVPMSFCFWIKKEPQTSKHLRLAVCGSFVWTRLTKR